MIVKDSLATLVTSHVCNVFIIHLGVDTACQWEANASIVGLANWQTFTQSNIMMQDVRFITIAIYASPSIFTFARVISSEWPLNTICKGAAF